MVILSVDYGDVRTGVAVCDPGEMIASPVDVIKETDPETLAEKLSAVAAEKKAREIIVGLPKNMDGSEGFRAQACREFGALLAERSGLPVVMRDERLTTVSAHLSLNMSNVHDRKKRKNTVDAVSAVILLEDYIRFRKNTNN